MTRTSIAVREIRAEDTERVGIFLHTHLNRRVPASSWAALVQPPWDAVCPNHGFQLVEADDRIVGAYIAVYSTREPSEPVVCNLAAFCVLEEHRSHSLRLVRALLRQKGYLFTDLSPSGSVPAMNERLGFQHLDTATRLVVNVPRPRRGLEVNDDPATLREVLAGTDAVVYRHHEHAPAARHALVVSGDAYAYLMYRRDRRKRLPVFASPLYVGGSTPLLETAWPAVASHLMRRGLPVTLAERRVLGFAPTGPGHELARPRPKMYRAGAGAPEPTVDYLYSELTLLQW